MQTSTEMQQCIDACLHCYTVCQQTAMNQCLETGGSHVEPEHFRLMSSCAEICRTTAHVMLSGTQLHVYVCAACAEICAACADSCQQIGGMDDCVQACRSCEQSCRQMAGYEGMGLLSQRAQAQSGLSGQLPM